MRHLDFSPLFRSSIGFDHLVGKLDAASRAEHQQPSYPPYNIERLSDDAYRITMAVAGFTDSEITVISNQNMLTISGEQDTKEQHEYLHRGIAARNFERKFQLADHVKVNGAKLENGLLHIELQREIPESMKPRIVEINSIPNKTPNDAILNSQSEEAA